MALRDMNRTAVGVTFSAIIALKVLFLVMYGPIFQPDSYGYLEFTDEMLGGTAWLHSIDLQENYWFEQSAFRVIGYPAILALAKTITSSHWAWLIVALQMVVSLIATVYVLRLTAALSGRQWVALVAAFAHAIGQALVLDQAILTDSLNASLLIIIAAYMGLGVLARRAPTLHESFALGLLLMLSFLMREAGSILQYLYWPLLLVWFIFTTHGKLRAVAVLAVLAMFAMFAAPLFISAGVYKAWNESRSGERFITTGAQTGMFVPLYKLPLRGIDPFANDEPLKHMSPSLNTMKDLTPYHASGLINAYLHKTHGYSALDIARKGYRVYFANWAAHPIDMAAITLSNLRLKLMFLSVMPVEAALQVALWAEGTSPLPRTKRELWNNLIEHQRVDQALMYLGRGVSRLVSVTIVLAFLVGVPWRMLRTLQRDGIRASADHPRTVLMFMFWLIFLGYTFAYAMISMEGRYLMPVMPLALASGLTLLAPWSEQMGRRALKWRHRLGSDKTDKRIT